MCRSKRYDNNYTETREQVNEVDSEIGSDNQRVSCVKCKKDASCCRSSTKNNNSKKNYS